MEETGFQFDVYMYLLPLIVIFGLSGNVISLVTIFHSRLRRYGHVDRAKVMLYWVPIPFVLQLFQFFSLEPATEERKCALKEANYQIIAQAVDTVLCYVVPCGIIVVLNILVALQVQKSQEHFMAETKKSNSRRTGGSSSSSGTWTRILWVMPLVFVVLNTPFYVIMMIEIVFQIIYQSPPSGDTRSELFVTVYNTAHYMYYMNTAIDVLVYAFSSANFRKTAVIAWKRILCPGYAERQKGKRFLLSMVHSVSDSIRKRIPIAQPAPHTVLVTDQTSRISYRMTSERSTIRFPNTPSRANSPKLTASNAVSVPLLGTEIQGSSKESTAI
ncbi:G-protein coupled receptors family 1 profile domain-containing protein [Caenorhabditis elegans]|uniref:G-protein coupled receptors family 1 profile domain-containing protein n=1 Tax=Caenorhabditis elegans TaxID=6239 RepID=H9G357_CAEEL|nr:G-protein coupled receptors family 1 profile domain-containing protein [Caenorhabditis elegans]CCG28189.1 G-protein coupled receptors family 1 profile domain-containing protein [Caenorhabditis elegans]|eukprot:NP_001256230.1 Uncharacterized protein CELE_H09F14.1 [Caenorhabditis elegans]